MKKSEEKSVLFWQMGSEEVIYIFFWLEASGF